MSEGAETPLMKRWQFRLLVALGLIGTMIGGCSGLIALGFPILRTAVLDREMEGTTTKGVALAVHRATADSATMLGPFDDRGGTLTDYPKDPFRRLSWRVAVLPYVGHEYTHRQFDLKQAWDSPANAAASSTRVRPFGDPIDANGYSTHTPYRVFYDNGALWDSDPARRIRLDKIPDGAANTVLVAESTVQVPWAQFNEHPFDPNRPLPELGRTSRNTFLLAMADGSVRTVKKGVDPNILRAAVTRDGGEQLPFAD